MIDIIELMKAIAAYGMLGLMCLLILYVYYRITYAIFTFIKNEVIPVILLKDDPDDRWED
ncbi:hypothetical protein KAR91_79645 [Candidatus Pacearchaeota archaeon]|nr:hypothetical protein [Candidatus Pacearchaeota archaeon]